MDVVDFYSLGFLLVVTGIIVIFATIILAHKGNSKKSRVRGAGIIMIGPFPIIFGTDKNSVKAILKLALALTIIALIIIVINYWVLR